jgi:hypothetical protein
MHGEPGGRVAEVVAVVHPDAGVVGTERDDGTSTPCQWIVTPWATSLLRRVTSTMSPCFTRSWGPGDAPLNVRASIVWPDASRTCASLAVSVKLSFGVAEGPEGRPR